MKANNFTASQLAKYFDHTALKPETTANDIKKLCEEAVELGTAAVCVNPLWIPLAVKCLQGSQVMPITVVGFPLGAMGTESKVHEAREAVACGAMEIDMVLSVGEIKSGLLNEARRDIISVKQSIDDVPLKVIFETALLNTDEIAMVARWCAEDGIDYVKTSTGFSSRGASVQDVVTMRQAINSVTDSRTKIKASGGIRTLKEAMSLIEAGAERIGASATKAIVAELSGGKVSSSKGY